MKDKSYLTFTLSAGTWRWFFRDRENLEPLSSICYIHFYKNKTELSFIIPDYLIGKKNVNIVVEKMR